MSGGTYGQAGGTYGQQGWTYGNFGGGNPRILWLVIYADPVLQLYADPGALDMLDPSLMREQVVAAFGRVVGLEGENPNMSVALVQQRPRVRTLFQTPPLGARAELRNSDGVLFEGVVSAVSLGGSPSVRIEA